jgi:hypothetical protein
VLLLFLTTTLHAMPASIARINGSVTIDGNLDDEAWRNAEKIESFRSYPRTTTPRR